MGLNTILSLSSSVTFGKSYKLFKSLSSFINVKCYLEL